jgi:hypothetical protein
VAFLSSFVTILQHALEQYKPKQTFEDAWVKAGFNSDST